VGAQHKCDCSSDSREKRPCHSMPSEDGFKNLKSRKAGKEDSKIKDIKKGREGKHEINPCLRKR